MTDFKEYKKYPKKKLRELLSIYEEEIDLLDIMLNEMSNVTLDSVQSWLDYVQKTIEEVKENSDVCGEGFYHQITVFEAIDNINKDKDNEN